MSQGTHPISENFTVALKDWRKLRKLSQLELALAADVSQRHVSWLETGRSKPSREMVLRLTEAMDVPLRDRNQILNLAGFANLYAEHDLTAPPMESVADILKDILVHHEPYPAFVLDKQWNIKMQNTAADTLFDVLGDPKQVWLDIGDTGEKNIALLTVHPKGLRRFISNWEEAIGPFMRRLRKEAIGSNDADILRRYEQLTEHAGEHGDEDITKDLLPVLPLEINLGGPALKLCSVISTFGTAQDITANELRIEAFYPADELTRKFFIE